MHVRPLLVNRPMDESLQIRLAAALVDGGAVELVLDNIVALDALGGPCSGQQIAFRIVGMAGADMTE